jgi:hypothetical protein
MATAPIQSLPVGYYQNLLTSEYKTVPKFNQWLLAVLSIANDITNCLQTITSSFDLDTATGVQLDILGVIVGVSRIVSFQPSGGISPILTDSVYRILLKATIANNEWDGKIGSLYGIWGYLFIGGTIVIQDNQNMTANIFLTGTFSSIIQDLVSNGLIVPRPETVQYTYNFGDLPFFGFDLEDSFISGWDVGKWS